jgi:hypothetical protein
MTEQELNHLKADIVMGKPLDTAQVAKLILAYDALRRSNHHQVPEERTLRLVARAPAK